MHESDDESSGEEDDISVKEVLEEDEKDGIPNWEPHLARDGMPETIIPEEEVVDSEGRPLDFESLLSCLINMEVCLPHNDVMKTGKVLRRSMNENDEYVGDYNRNPMLDTMLYEVEFNHGTVHEYGANVIASNLFDQVDKEGYREMSTIEILDHRMTDNAVDKDHQYVNT